MKNAISAVLVVATLCAACSAAQVQRGLALADEIERNTCIVANAALPTDADVMKACHLAPVFLDLVHRVVGEQRVAMSLASSRRCGK